MREILFRGKRTDTGAWVYGDLDQYNRDDVCILDNEGYLHGVDSGTVGQYTGLKDKNGKLIFEGDILQIIGYGEVIEHCSIGYGIYDQFGGSTGVVGFFLCWERDIRQERKYANLSYWVNEREAVCIGNIHDK